MIHVIGKTAGNKPGPSTLLTKEEEKILVNYIHLSERRAMPVTKDKVFDTVAAIIADEEAKGIIHPRQKGSSVENYRPKNTLVAALLKKKPFYSN